MVSPQANDQRLESSKHDSELGSWVEVHAIPHPALSPFVAALWYGEGITRYRTERFLPQGCAHMLFNLGPPQFLVGRPEEDLGPACFRHIWVSGPQSSYLDIESSGAIRMIGVAFKSHGAYRFLHRPQSELAGQVIEGAALLGDRIERLRGRLLEMSSPGEGLALVESWLLKRLASAPRAHPAVDHLVQGIEASDGRLRVRRMAEETGFSRMHLSRLFLREVGLTPKKLARIHRFHSSIAKLQSSDALDWAALAIDQGYYDQAHLIRDFKDFAGWSPEKLLKAPRPDANSLVTDRADT